MSPQSLSHLPDQSEEYINMADLEVKANDTIYPCHSYSLASHSKVFRDMFSCMPKKDWAKGFAEAFAGNTENDVTVFLEVMYGNTSSLRSNDNLMGLVRLAHKLDCPTVVKVRALSRAPIH